MSATEFLETTENTTRLDGFARNAEGARLLTNPQRRSRTMRCLPAAITVALFCSVVASADELKPFQEEAKAKFDKELEKPIATMNAKCETKVELKTDFQNFDKAKWGSDSIYGYCAQVFEGLTQLCGRPAFKKALSQKLKGVSCLFGGVKSDAKTDNTNEGTRANMSFVNGAFEYHMLPSISRSNVVANTSQVVEKALD